MLNGVNSRLLHSPAHSCEGDKGGDFRGHPHFRFGTVDKDTSCALDRTHPLGTVDTWIRSRRAQWLGCILRMDPTRMVHQTVEIIHVSRVEGDLLMDTGLLVEGAGTTRILTYGCET